MSEILFRPYNLDDEMRITDLFMHCSPHKRTTGFWKWINRSSPFGDSIVVVGEKNGQIIGTYAVMPNLLQIGSNNYQAGFAIQLIVHTNYRSFKNTINLTDMVLGECEKKGMEFVYAFPNEIAFPLHIKAMGWKHPTDFKSLEIYLNKIKSDFTLDQDIKIERVNSFSKQIEDIYLQSSVSALNKIMIVRNKHYLNWRFFGNPIEHYIVFVARKHEEVCGYIVLKIYHKENIIYGHLVDFLTKKENEEKIFQSLLLKAFEFFKWAKADIISTWCPPSNPYFQILHSIGFKTNGINTHFVLKPIINDIPMDYLNNDNWFFTMADSDAF